MYRSKALKKLPAKDFWSHNRFTGGALAIFATLLLASISAHPKEARSISTVATASSICTSSRSF